MGLNKSMTAAERAALEHKDEPKKPKPALMDVDMDDSSASSASSSSSSSASSAAAATNGSKSKPKLPRRPDPEADDGAERYYADEEVMVCCPLPSPSVFALQSVALM